MEKRRQCLHKLFLILLAGLIFSWPAATSGQQSAASVPGRTHVLPQNGVFLVFPFENTGATPRLEWIGAGLEELTIQKLSTPAQPAHAHHARLDHTDIAPLPPHQTVTPPPIPP